MTDLTDLSYAVAYINQKRLTDPADLNRRLTILEEHMTAADAKIEEVTANLNNIRADVQRLNDLAVNIQAQTDEATAAKLQPLVDLSKQIADATPEPAPTDGGGAPPVPAP